PSLSLLTFLFFCLNRFSLTSPLPIPRLFLPSHFLFISHSTSLSLSVLVLSPSLLLPFTHFLASLYLTEVHKYVYIYTSGFHKHCHSLLITAALQCWYKHKQLWSSIFFSLPSSIHLSLSLSLPI